MNCVICHSHVYDEFLLINDKDDQPICLNCDDPQTIFDWELEHTEDWQDAFNRYRGAEGWYGVDLVHNGWKDIIITADEMLSHIDPNYKIQQVKEKFGALRFYFSTELLGTPVLIMHAVTDSIEHRSKHVCEICGSFARLREDLAYLSTLCNSCYEAIQND
jgi:hypothetical protein